MKLPPFRLEHYFARYEFTTPYMLSGSDSESLTIGELLSMQDGATEEFHRHWLGYTESTGHPALREEISKLYKTIDPNDVLVHSGAQEAIFTFLNSVLKPGDHVIVHWPCYQSLHDLPVELGCEVTRWPAQQKHMWSLDLDFLRDHLKKNTRLVIVNLPHNPTGYLMDTETFRELNRLSLERGFLLFSDEVYRGLEYDERRRLPAACDINDFAVSLGVLSKSFGLAGLRIGWIATRNRMVFEAMNSLKHYTTICNSAPSEYLGRIALEHRDRILHRNRSIAVENLRILNAFFERFKEQFGWVSPEAGVIGFPSLLKSDDADAFCGTVLRKSGVLLLPGTVYDPDSRHFRIGYGRSNFAESLSRFEKFLLSKPA